MGKRDEAELPINVGRAFACLQTGIGPFKPFPLYPFAGRHAETFLTFATKRRKASSRQFGKAHKRRIIHVVLVQECFQIHPLTARADKKGGKFFEIPFGKNVHALAQLHFHQFLIGQVGGFKTIISRPLKICLFAGIH